MNFLSEEQQDKIKENGWDLIDSEVGCFWAGWDWDSKENPLYTISKQTSLEDSRGYDFLIIAKRKVK
jgi:hypothetical protein